MQNRPRTQVFPEICAKDLTPFATLKSEKTIIKRGITTATYNETVLPDGTP
jgi:hypothetical protein